jgi:parallel beta-helix repeat protein
MLRRMENATRLLLITSLLLVPAAGAGAHADKLPVRKVSCGETITASLRLANSLLDCPGDGLIVGAPGITIDLGGHRIDGVGVENGDTVGIRNEPGHAGVTIRNGLVTQFYDGVRLVYAAGNSLSALRVLQNDTGIRLVSSDRGEIRGCVATDNDNGFSLEGFSRGNAFVENEASGNDYDGFYVEESGGTFTGNTASANGSYGFELYTAKGALLKGNVVRANLGAGIVIDVDSAENVLKGNRSSGNGTHGIEIFSGTGNVLTRNTFEENAGHGIRSDTSALELRANRADRNGYANGNADGLGLGILVPAGAIQSGNKATGNDDGRECQSTELSCAVPTVPVTRR